MDVEDFARLFAREPDKFNAAGSLADFAAAIGGAHGELLARYAGGWAGQYFATCKAHPGVFLARPLALPAARTFADLFDAAELAAHVILSAREGSRLDTSPGFVFVSGSRSRGAAPTVYAGGRRGVVAHRDGTAHRSRHGARFLMCTAKPSAATRAACEAHGLDVSSFETVERADGLLVIARDRGGIFTTWLALLDAGESLAPLMRAEDRATLEAEREADARAWACIVKGPDGREYLDEAAAAAAGVVVERRG